MIEVSTHQVLDRYHELRSLVGDLAARDVADPHLTAAVAPHLTREARLLDTARYDEWLADWTDDAVMWIPIDGGVAGPGDDQSLLLDDRRRIGERIAWRRDPSAWGQQPASVTVRAVGNVEAWRDGDRLVARSTIVLTELRRDRQQVLAGHQIHQLEPATWRRRTKIMLFPVLAVGVHNPSFLL